MTEGTAYQLYQQPIDDLNRSEEEEHSWDREIDRLHAQDEHGEPTPPMENGKVAVFELEELKAWMETRQRAREDDELPRRVYNTAEKRRENEEHVDELMADFEARLAKGEHHGDRP